ncbi:adenylate/guanylate cyclase domain-containing protein [Zooshikella ganghwensis]|uniref:Adenylate/guanylate cyclase domain-containing protein n=1 Tax=Zooshikella ganghwensis TaxID=202772 RepID=A0A4P9VLA5_9GAMM|nr:adenylate/guanylate cyclase domain-containing protein [Zooshikella ganghwensis]RDH42900.1 adenylate/guanylate cyclase domain-containing protein [Zooshikella ganghwensis]
MNDRLMYFGSMLVQKGIVKVITIMLISGILGYIYSLNSDRTFYHVITLSILVSLLVSFTELNRVMTKVAEVFVQLNQLIFALVLSVVATLIISVVEYYSLVSTQIFIPQCSQPFLEPKMWHDIIYSFLLALGLNFILRIKTHLGTATFWGLFLGKYRTPINEQRVFMFIDLVGSTGLTRELGDKLAQQFFSHFFADIAGIVSKYGGFMQRVIGDEVLVTWQMKNSADNQRCIQCVESLCTLMEARKDEYLKRYGKTPDFRISIHSGDVLVAEVGTIKRELVFFGDTINTAAKMMAVSKEKNARVIASARFMESIKLPEIFLSRTVTTSSQTLPVKCIALELK